MKTDYLLHEQVERVLSLLTPVNRLVMRVALSTGLRVSDILALRRSDIDKGQQFWITEQKTGKRRKVALERRLWSELREQAGIEWVFPNRCGADRHRTRQSVWKDIKRAQKALRLPQNAGCHSARKIYAVELMRKYGDIERVKRALNHDRSATTMIYAMADSLMSAKHKKPRAGR